MKTFTGDDLRYRGYHDYHKGFTPVGSGDILVGLEMEVGSFTSRDKVLSELSSAGIKDDFFIPTSDGSLDSGGIEFVTHPLGSDFIKSDLRDILDEIFPIMKKNGGKAEDARCSCGCHHNISKRGMTDKNWAIAIQIVFRYYDLVFNRFNGPNRQAEGHYSSIPNTTDLLTRCKANGKYSFFHFRNNGVVELRFPAMTLDPKKFMVQTNLCLKAIEYASLRNEWNPLEETFHSIFAPTTEDLELLESIGVHKRVLSGAY